MRYAVQYPMPAMGLPPTAYAADLAAFATTAEAAGFDAICFTEHPAPPTRWMEGGGHASFDPFVALAYCAALTSRITLMTSLTVPAYRNPLLWTKSAMSLDVLARGRLVLTCGAGYLRSEFAAVGVDFEERNALFDEALEVVTGAWASPDAFEFAGRHFAARPTSFVPRAVQPAPPIWIGGNGRIARERVVRHGTGWAPLLIDDAQAAVSRTRALTSLDDLAVAVADLRERLTAAGRDPDEVEICVQSPTAACLVDPARGIAYDASAGRAWAAGAHEAGATWVTVTVESGDPAADREAVESYGADVIRRPGPELAVGRPCPVCVADEHDIC